MHFLTNEGQLKNTLKSNRAFRLLASNDSRESFVKFLLSFDKELWQIVIISKQTIDLF